MFIWYVYWWNDNSKDIFTQFWYSANIKDFYSWDLLNKQSNKIDRLKRRIHKQSHNSTLWLVEEEHASVTQNQSLVSFFLSLSVCCFQSMIAALSLVTCKSPNVVCLMHRTFLWLVFPLMHKYNYISLLAV